jgi:hypothetical protein
MYKKVMAAYEVGTTRALIAVIAHSWVVGCAIAKLSEESSCIFPSHVLRCSGKPNMGGLHFILRCCFTVACSQALEAKDPLHSFPLFSAPFLAILSANSFPKISEWDGVKTVEISHPVSRSVQAVLIACLAGSELYLLNRSASIAEVLSIQM